METLRRQQIPPINDKEYLEKITNSKRGKRKIRLHNIRLKINQAYIDFIANRNTLGALSPITLGKLQKKDMEHCYDTNTVELSKLKSAISMSHSPVDRELCPYCGVREPSEFDHYLPKSKFQEFSIFSKNLIWTCHRCNHLKKEHFVAADRYINTYYDFIPEEQFLFCTVGVPIEEQGVSFYFTKPGSVTTRQYNDILCHADKLKLLDTYLQRASQKLPNWLQKWEMLAEDYEKSELLRYLKLDIRAQIRVAEKKYGKNYFNRVLLLGVSDKLKEIVDHIYT